VDFLGGTVVDGLSEAVQATMVNLLNNLDAKYLEKNDMNALLEIKLELVGPTIEFTPSIDSKIGNELRISVSSWIKDFMKVGVFVARLDSGLGSYLMEIEEDESVMMQICQVSGKLTKTEESCIGFMDTFRTFEYLWVKDINESFDEFMTLAETEGAEPTLEQFNAQISRYKVSETIQRACDFAQCVWLHILISSACCTTRASKRRSARCRTRSRSAGCGWTPSRLNRH
jgi:hypothetical protein